MSLVPFTRTNAGSAVETGHDVLRIWLDKEQTRRLRDGQYMATVVRQENSCWIRGSLDDDVVFLMDNADPPEDNPDAAGSFYNKAPRFTVLGSRYLKCERSSRNACAHSLYPPWTAPFIRTLNDLRCRNGHQMEAS